MSLWNLVRRHPALTVALATLMVGTVMTSVLGVRLGGDSSRYLDAAEHMLNTPWPGKSASYAGYVLIVALSRPIGLVGLVVVQVLAAAVASIALFDIGRQLSGVVAGVAGGLLFAVNIKIASWHSYVLTDSMYISLVVITVWAVHRAAEKRNIATYATGTVVTVFTASLRPTGWILVPVVASYWVWRRIDSTPIRLTAVAAIAIGFGVMVLTVPLLARGVLVRLTS